MNDLICYQFSRDCMEIWDAEALSLQNLGNLRCNNV